MAQSYRVESPESQVHCVLIADDLTGACDAAAPFRAQGASVQVFLKSERKTGRRYDVLSISTGSRDLPFSEMKRRLASAAANLQYLHPGIIFKKIDSTLRGNPGGEIAAALEAFGCESAVIAPAFPAMGRHVHEGYLHSNRDPAWRPIHVQTQLRTQGILDCEHMSPGNLHAALTRRARFISVDATTEEDLETIVAETLSCRRRILWAGSAGLASALSRAVFPGTPKQGAPSLRNAPVLFVIGSDHIVTAMQINELSSRFALHDVNAAPASSDTLSAGLRSGRHTILRIGRSISTATIANLLAGSEQLIAALLLSGGDTAALVCDALGASGILLEGEIVAGIPWGFFESGLFDKLPVATKSGAFGGPNALIEVAEFFSWLTH